MLWGRQPGVAFGLLLCVWVCAASAAFANQGETQLAEQQFVLDAILLEENSRLPDSTVSAIVQPYVGNLVKIEDLQSVRLALTQAYVDAGYVNSGVVIPKQHITDGRVRMRAIEGALSEVRVSGTRRLREGYVANRLLGEPTGPLNLNNLQSALRLLRNDASIQRLDARLLPGSEPGKSLLEVDVSEAPNLAFGLSVDNHQAKALGEFRERLAVDVRNLLGVNDFWSISGALSDGADDQSASFAVPINRHDTLLIMSYGRSDARIVESLFRELDIESRTRTWQIGVQHPLIRSVEHSANVGFSVRGKKSRSTLLGIPVSLSPGAENGVSRSTALSLSGGYAYRTPQRLFSLDVSWSRGVDAFGATIFRPQTTLEQLSNPTRADGRFDLFSLQALFVTQPSMLPAPEGTQFLLRATAQYSSDPLMSMDKLAIGGASSVRGYRENLLVRDNGIAATAQLDVPIRLGASDASWRRVVVSPFLDFGQSWDEANINTFAPTNGTNEKRRILGLGLGLRWQPLRGLTLEASWAKKISDNFPDGSALSGCGNAVQCGGWHLSLSYRGEYFL